MQKKIDFSGRALSNQMVSNLYTPIFGCKLVREFTEENDKDEHLFDLFINTLHEIANKGYPAVNIIALEIQMLALLGYLPELNFVSTAKKVEFNKYFFFCVLEGRGDLF